MVEFQTPISQSSQSITLEQVFSHGPDADIGRCWPQKQHFQKPMLSVPRFSGAQQQSPEHQYGPAMLVACQRAGSVTPMHLTYRGMHCG